MSKKICLLTNLIYFITLVLFVVLRVCSACGVFSFLGVWASVVLGIVTQIGIIFLLPFCLFKFLSKATFKQTLKFYGFKKTSWKTILLSFVLGLCVFCLTIYVSGFFNGIIQALGYKPSSSVSSGNEIGNSVWVLFLNLFITAVLPAFCEEILHRGMLLNGNTSQGIKKAILISGFLFGLLHLNIEQVFYASIIGLFLGYLALGCNSIYPCIIVHFMNNAVSVFLSFAAGQGWAVGKIIEKLAVFVVKAEFVGFLIVVLVFVFLLFAAYDISQLMIKHSFNYNFSKKEQEFANFTIREQFFQDIDKIKNNKGTAGDRSQQVVRVSLEDFLKYLSENLNSDEIVDVDGALFVPSQNELLNQKKNQSVSDQKMCEKKANFFASDIDLKIRILIYGSFVLSLIVTIMTFIWGLLR